MILAHVADCLGITVVRESLISMLAHVSDALSREAIHAPG